MSLPSSETTGMPRTNMHENRQTSVVPTDSAQRPAEPQSHKVRMREWEQSHSAEVPMNYSNKEVRDPAEVGECSPRPEENAGQSGEASATSELHGHPGSEGRASSPVARTSKSVPSTVLLSDGASLMAQ